MIGVAATTFLLVNPASAAARPGDEIRPRSLHLTMAAAGTRGYDVTVDTLGHHRVTLTVAKHGQLASYMTRGQVSRHQVKADFGRFGRVSLRFHGKRRPFPAPPRQRSKPRTERTRTVCRGRDPQREIGRFHGTIEFDGQHGYTRLAVGKLHGEVRRSYRQVCRQVPIRRHKKHHAHRVAVASNAGADPFGFNLTLLSARSRVGHALTRFTAISLEPPRGIPVPARDLFSVITASLQERVGRVRVFRSAMQFAAPARVRISRRGVEPVTARLALASPFSGRALYRSAKGSRPSWTGSLGVRFLGSNLVPLTGPRFHAVLCRVSAFNPRQSCFRRAEARAARAAASRSRPVALP